MAEKNADLVGWHGFEAGGLLTYHIPAALSATAVQQGPPPLIQFVESVSRPEAAPTEQGLLLIVVGCGCGGRLHSDINKREGSKLSTNRGEKQNLREAEFYLPLPKKPEQGTRKNRNVATPRRKA
jgi:hypothetical protein